MACLDFLQGLLGFEALLFQKVMGAARILDRHAWV